MTARSNVENRRNKCVAARFGITAAVVSLSAGCSGDRPTIDAIGRVRGQVLAGPTCPVEQTGDTNCEPVPVQGTVQFRQSGDVIDSVAIDLDGDYSLQVPAGFYTLTFDTGDTIFPTCSPVDVEVLAEVEVNADVFCDTGIR